MDLAHVRRGSGPAVIVIQQLDPAAFWEPVVDLLAGTCETVAVDLPGFGETPPLPDGRPPTVAALTSAVAAWIDGAGLGGAHVAGSSLGGAVALELAKHGAVAGAVAVSPVGFWTSREARLTLLSLRVGRTVARAVASRPGPLTGTALGRKIAFGQLVARPSDMPEPAARAALAGMAGAPGFAETRRELLRYRFEGPEPEVPVTVAWAAKDRLTPPHQAERAKRLLPRAHHVTLAGCGHAAMVDDPGLVARVVLDAMARAGNREVAAQSSSAG